MIMRQFSAQEHLICPIVDTQVSRQALQNSVKVLSLASARLTAETPCLAAAPRDTSYDNDRAIQGNLNTWGIDW
jgi:hypothetical protein